MVAVGSTWDYGPLGIELKRNVKEAWWRAMVMTRSDVVGLDSAILQHPRTWEASGHLQNFTDPLVDCKSCKQRLAPTMSRAADAPSAAALTVSNMLLSVQQVRSCTCAYGADIQACKKLFVSASAWSGLPER